METASLTGQEKETAFGDLRKARVLLVDDEAIIRDVVTEMLQDEVSELVCAGTLDEARQCCLQGRFNIGLIDLALPDGNGFNLIRDLRAIQSDMAFILVTGKADRETAMTMDSFGVQAILTKPFTLTQLKFSICRELIRLQECCGNGVFGPDSPEEDDFDLKGSSEYIRDLRRKVRQFSQGDVPVLIQGPTGTGKEIVARAIHSQSRRRDKPLIIVNSSAIPEHLEESEFFGHARGAFTGAHEHKDGILKCAHGTTLFLDEVGELSLRMQAKLLRVLDGHEFFRVGDTTPQKVDFRLVSATNRPLHDMVQEGTFRQDLYFRLKACTLQTQPLRFHREDIPCLVEYFLARSKTRGSRGFTVTGGALEMLVDHEWAGNVRELKNTIDSLCIVAGEHGVISEESIEWIISGIRRETRAPIVPFSEAKINFERDYYRVLLDRFNGNISMASRASGIERAYFSKRIRTLGLQIDEFKHKEMAV